MKPHTENSLCARESGAGGPGNSLSCTHNCILSGYTQRKGPRSEGLRGFCYVNGQNQTNCGCGVAAAAGRKESSAIII